MAFDRNEVSKLLAECHRRCCICHRFCGVKMETDHMLPTAEKGNDEISNAIPVCFECHAEIHCYNDKHPRGRKFTTEELQQHKKQWLDICANTPTSFIDNPRDKDAGPLYGMLNELEFNYHSVSFSLSERCDNPTQSPKVDNMGCALKDRQFERAINEGVISLLGDDLKESICGSYTLIGRATGRLHAYMNNVHEDKRTNELKVNTRTALKEAKASIKASIDKLVAFLGSQN